MLRTVNNGKHSHEHGIQIRGSFFQQRVKGQRNENNNQKKNVRNENRKQNLNTHACTPKKQTYNIGVKEK